MTEPTRALRLGSTAQRRIVPFEIIPDADGRAALAAEFGVEVLRKLAFRGRLLPAGAHDWRLEARLGATVVQTCGLTLAPVTTRIDEDVTRRYLAAFDPADLPAEAELPADDSVEPLPATLDPAAVMAEALALAIPPFPRAPGAEVGSVAVTEPGAEPLTDDVVRPFAGLKDELGRED